MRLLIFTSPFNATGRKLLTAMRSLDESLEVQHIADIETLSACLHQPMRTPTIGILAPSDPMELAAMIDLRHLLRDMRIVLILPDTGNPIVNGSHLLRPRYVGQAEGNLSDVAAVVNRMVQGTMSEPVYAAR